MSRIWAQGAKVQAHMGMSSCLFALHTIDQRCSCRLAKADNSSAAQIFKAGSASPAANGPLLEQLTHLRKDIAQILGSPSFAHHQLRDGLLAGSPEAVQQFLDTFSADLKPLVSSRCVAILCSVQAAQMPRSSSWTPSALICGPWYASWQGTSVRLRARHNFVPQVLYWLHCFLLAGSPTAVQHFTSACSSVLRPVVNM